MKEAIGDLVVMLLLVALLLVGIIGCSALTSQASCNALADNTGHPTRFTYFGGGDAHCLIQIDGEWIPTSNWRVIQ